MPSWTFDFSFLAGLENSVAREKRGLTDGSCTVPVYCFVNTCCVVTRDHKEGRMVEVAAIDELTS